MHHITDPLSWWLLAELADLSLHSQVRYQWSDAREQYASATLIAGQGFVEYKVIFRYDAPIQISTMAGEYYRFSFSNNPKMKEHLTARGARESVLLVFPHEISTCSCLHFVNMDSHGMSWSHK